MGSEAKQGKLWGQRPEDWAAIQEITAKEGYDFVISKLQLTSDTKLLDVGCGTGYFCKLASDEGASVIGFDATPQFLEHARKLVPQARFILGEMEELPFGDQSFDVVCGFNSFQYASDSKNALAEAKRVLKDGGKLVTMIWGNKEDCEAATYLKAVGSLLPPPPPGASCPFALSENHLLENMLEELGFEIINNSDVESVWDYTDSDIAIKGLMSAGPVAAAIENSGFEKTYETVSKAIEPYMRSDGHIIYHNKWRVIISEK